MNDVEREILRLEEELTHTEMRVDVDALDKVYADDIMVTAPIGLVVDKPAVIESSAIKRIDPVYPERAREARVSGSVVIEVFIDTLGNVTSARALSGSQLLHSSAVDAARGWKWEPFKQAGVPVNVRGALTFKFQSDGDSKDSEEITEAKAAIEAEPDSVEAHNELGEAYEDSHRYDEAAEAFKKALSIKPDDVDACRSLASVYEKLGRYQ
jgi:TonB family protein